MSTQPNPLEGLEIKAGTQSGAAAQSKAGLQSEVAAVTPRAARFAANGAAPPLRYGASSTIDISEDDAAEPTAAVPVPNSPKPSAPSSSDVLHPDSQTALEQLGYDDETISKLNLPQVRTIIKHQLPAKYAAPPETSSVPADPAADILRAEPNLTNEQRADLHDHFTQAKSMNDFADRITPIPVSNDLKHRLWIARQEAIQPVAVAPVDNVVAAIQKMVALPADVLKTANDHPELLRAYVSAATKG